MALPRPVVSPAPALPYGRQSISADDIAAVEAVLRSDFLTQGPAIERFEAKVAAACGARHAVATANATAALHVACLATGLGPGDRLWTSPNSFVASSNCALYCGATVEFIDIRPDTYNLDPDLLGDRLEQAARLGRLPKIVVPVHFAGQPCRMDRIAALCDLHGVTVLEDASHAIGARFRGEPVGSGRYARMAVFSFHPVKIVTSGEGGMLVTNDDGIARAARRLRTHGITRDPADMTAEPEGAWCYEQLELGFNYRMTDLQAALGASQMDRLDEFVARRNELARRYDERLAHLPIVRPHRDPDLQSAFHLYPIRVDRARGARARAAVFAGLRARGIGVNVHYIPIPAQPHYRRLGFSPDDVPHAQAYYQDALSLPLFPAMTDADVDRVVAALDAEVWDHR